jgi:hypothetical protein
MEFLHIDEVVDLNRFGFAEHEQVQFFAGAFHVLENFEERSTFH